MNISVPSLKRLCISSLGHTIQVMINTPRLEYIRILGDKPCRYTVYFPSSIVDACLGDGFDVCLLYGIFQSNYLVLRGNYKSLCFRDPGLPKFNKLVAMTFLVGASDNWKLLPNLLQCSPNLEVLVIEVLLSFNRDVNQFNWQQPESVPECLGLHLEIIEIIHFMGSREELRIVEYLLDSGKVLDKMKIHRLSQKKTKDGSR